MVNAPADLELARRMLAGDEEAFEAFGECYPKALYRFALTRLDGDRELTRDLVQSAICKALAKLESYRGEASLLTWLCACCRNEILMHFRAKRSAPEERQLDDAGRPGAGLDSSGAGSGGVPGNPMGNPLGDPTAGGDPEVVALRRETTTLVHMALDVLPGRYGEALEAKYLERLSVRQIAARLGVGEKAAESLLTRARQAFRETYERLRRERSTLAGSVSRRNRRGLGHG